MIPFLFMTALNALAPSSHTRTTQSDALLPKEENVHVHCLSNGVKTYIQENDHPAHFGAFRVVVRQSDRDVLLYSYECRENSLDIVEDFFDFCQEKLCGIPSTNPQEQIEPSLNSSQNYTFSHLPSSLQESPQEISVVAVGNFQWEQMRELIKKHFEGIKLATQQQFSPVRITSDSNLSKVAMRISFPHETRSLQTYQDLKEVWKGLLLQELYQQRLELSSKSLEESWIHPHPRFFHPVTGYTLSSEGYAENLLSFLLWQIETMRNEGFSEEEFFVTKRNLLNQLQYLSSVAAAADNAFLASYYADQFLLGEQTFSCDAFLEASASAITEIKSADLYPYLQSFFADQKRSIELVYPEQTQIKRLTYEQIEEMTEKIETLAASYRETTSPSISNRKEKNLVWQVHKDEQEPLFQLADNRRGSSLMLANQAPIVLVNVDAFQQLPLSDREKKIISFIVTTIAEKNIFQLALEKRSMEKKGKKIGQVHPLRFIGYIISDPELKNCLKQIRKSSFKWDAFIDGYAKRMKEEYANDNLFKYLPGFAAQVGASEAEVREYIVDKDFEGLVKALLK